MNSIKGEPLKGATRGEGRGGLGESGKEREGRESCEEKRKMRVGKQKKGRDY